MVKSVSTAGLAWDDGVAAAELGKRPGLRVAFLRGMGDRGSADGLDRRARMEQLFGRAWDLPAACGGVFTPRGEASDDENVLNDRSAPALRREARTRYERRFGPLLDGSAQDTAGDRVEAGWPRADPACHNHGCDLDGFGVAAAASTYVFGRSWCHAAGQQEQQRGADAASHPVLHGDASLGGTDVGQSGRADEAAFTAHQPWQCTPFDECVAAHDGDEEIAVAAQAGACTAEERICNACGAHFFMTTHRQCAGGMCQVCTSARIKLARLIGPEAKDGTLRCKYGAASGQQRSYADAFRRAVAATLNEQPEFFTLRVWTENHRHPKRQLEALLGMGLEAFFEACPCK